jgi:small subunit ribosomal protein S6
MKYELMAILEPGQTDQKQEKLLNEIKQVFTDHGLEFVEEDIWGLRDLAYKIKGRTQGYYAVINFEGEGTQLPQVKEELKLMNGIVRYIIIKMPEDYALMRYDRKVSVALDKAAVETVANKPKLSEQAAKLQEKVVKSAAKAEEKAEKAEKPAKEAEKAPAEETPVEEAPAVTEEAPVEEPVKEAEEKVEEAPAVTEEAPADTEEKAEEKEEKSKLDEKLQAIIDDTDIDL